MLCVLVSEATGYPSKTLATLLNADWEERIVRPNSAAVRPSLGYCAKNASDVLLARDALCCTRCDQWVINHSGFMVCSWFEWELALALSYWRLVAVQIRSHPKKNSASHALALGF